MLRHIASHRAPCLPVIWLVALTLAVSSVSAAPITYSESVSGDLPEASPLTLFVLDVGVNTVSGTCGFVGVNDFDSFAFVIPAGMQITSGNVVLTDAEGDFISSAWGLFQGSAEPMGGTLVGSLVCPSPGAASFPGTPLGPDTYNMWHGTFTGLGSGNNTGNYTFTMTVIPEPASLALLALVGTALLRRRQ